MHHSIHLVHNPSHPPEKVYDVALAFDCQVEDYFSLRVRERCVDFGLSLFVVDHIWASEFLGKLRQGQIAVRFLLDMASDSTRPDTDVFYQLAETVKSQGGHVVDDPDASLVAANKGRFHHILAENDVPVPFTIMVPREQIGTYRLPDEARARLGTPFVIKPGGDFGHRGVVLDATGEADLARSASQSQCETFLIQELVKPRNLDGRVAWFRVFYVVGEVIPCWWDPHDGEYQLVTPYEKRTYHLSPLEHMVRKIARLSGMDFFSTEVALTAEGHFIAIDYLNDQCDMNSKSYYTSGVPDAVVRRIAWLLISHAYHLIGKGPFDDEMSEVDRELEPERQQRAQQPAG
jgi:hypothetical protein